MSYRLSQVAGIYLRDIIPFRFMINPNTPRHGFLFANSEEPWSTKQLTDALTRETTKRIGFRLTTQEYRHVSIAIDRKFIRVIQEPDAEDEDEDDVHDLMAAHSTKLATARYARMGGLTRSLTPESISVVPQSQDKWQRWFKLQARRSIPIANNDGSAHTTSIYERQDAVSVAPIIRTHWEIQISGAGGCGGGCSQWS